MSFDPGDPVERCYGRGDDRFGNIQGRVREGYDTWYVTTGVGMTFCDNGRPGAHGRGLLRWPIARAKWRE